MTSFIAMVEISADLPVLRNVILAAVILALLRGDRDEALR